MNDRGIYRDYDGSRVAPYPARERKTMRQIKAEYNKMLQSHSVPLKKRR